MNDRWRARRNVRWKHLDSFGKFFYNMTDSITDNMNKSGISTKELINLLFPNIKKNKTVSQLRKKNKKY